MTPLLRPTFKKWHTILLANAFKPSSDKWESDHFHFHYQMNSSRIVTVSSRILASKNCHLTHLIMVTLSVPNDDTFELPKSMASDHKTGPAKIPIYLVYSNLPPPTLTHFSKRLFGLRKTHNLKWVKRVSEEGSQPHLFGCQFWEEVLHSNLNELWTKSPRYAIVRWWSDRIFQQVHYTDHFSKVMLKSGATLLVPIFSLLYLCSLPSVF